MLLSLREYGSKSSETTRSSWSYSKDKATNFNNAIKNTDDFKSFKSKAKLLGNTVAQPAPNQSSGILKNAITAVPLKYLSNF